jgi:ABC-type multidrug transport system fused ATPase/permease subunit
VSATCCYMKNISRPGNRPLMFVTGKENDSSLSHLITGPKRDHSRWLYLAARISIMIFSLVLFFSAFVFGADGSWDIATFFFILAVLMVIPFIILGRKLIEAKKSQNRF